MKLVKSIFFLLFLGMTHTVFSQNGKCIQGECRTGTGTYQWPTGDKYVGQFVDYKIQGTGTYYWANGSRYEGQWVQNRQEGQGKLFLTNGMVQSGNWKGGKFMDEVVPPKPTTTTTTTVVEAKPKPKPKPTTGCISGDCKNGISFYKWPDGSSYEGMYTNGAIHGKGVYKWKDGSYYDGAWKNNKRDGYGTYLGASGKKMVGNWSKDQFIEPEKKAVVTTATTTEDKKEGCVSGDCENGSGKYVLGPKEYYEGDFADGSFNGYGSYFWADGSKYTGEWKNNKRDGQGTYYFPNLKRRAGIWSAGKFVREVEGHSTVISETVIRPDISAPEVAIVEPAISRGIVITVKDKDVTVKGYAEDESGVKSIRIAGVQAKLEEPGAKKTKFSARVPLQVGQNDIWAEATDMQGNSGRQEFKVNREETMSDAKYAEVGASNKKTALVIGNTDYSVAPLKNATNDSDSIALELAGLGFDVHHHKNVNFQEMETAIENFGASLQKNGGVGMVFYAGHGIQVQGENYLVPVSANIKRENDIKYKSVHMGYLLDQLEKAGNDLNIVVLDACRDNPYASKYRSTLKNGLAGVAIAPVGTFIAYATSPGTTASDGTGENGLYTQELLKAMRLQGLKLEDMFKLVRTKVRKISNNTQIPWENSSLEGDFYFRR